MSIRRATDRTDRSVFQTDRFFISQGKWFFNTRESTTMGPFDRRPEAEQALVDFIAVKTGRKPSGWNVPGAAH